MYLEEHRQLEKALYFKLLEYQNKLATGASYGTG